MTTRVSDLFATKTVTLEGHKFLVRRPTTEEGVAWVKGIPSLPAPKPGEGSAPDPAKVYEAIAKFLVEMDGATYDAIVDPPRGFPFSIAIPLYNAIYGLAVPEEEAELARRVL
jgi:hypothetical protein